MAQTKYLITASFLIELLREAGYKNASELLKKGKIFYALSEEITFPEEAFHDLAKAMIEHAEKFLPKESR